MKKFLGRLGGEKFQPTANFSRQGAAVGKCGEDCAGGWPTLGPGCGEHVAVPTFRADSARRASSAYPAVLPFAVARRPVLPTTRPPNSNARQAPTVAISLTDTVFFAILSTD